MLSVDKIPKTGYDLIDLLDATIEKPVLPITAAGVASLGDERARLELSFRQGVRSLVDTLRDLKAQEIEEKLLEATPDASPDDVKLAQAPSKFPGLHEEADGPYQQVAPGSHAVFIGEGKLGS